MTKQVLMSTGSLPFRTITASVRTSVLTGLALAAALFLPAVIQGQAPPDIPPPSDTLYEVSLADGSVIIARIAEVDEERVVLTTPGGGRVEIGRDQIRGIRPVRGRVVEGELWHEDPSTTRLLFTATGRSLGKGEAYVGTYVIALPFAAVGITDRVSIAAGAPVLFGELEPFYVGPRVQIVRTPRHRRRSARSSSSLMTRRSGSLTEWLRSGTRTRRCPRDSVSSIRETMSKANLHSCWVAKPGSVAGSSS